MDRYELMYFDVAPIYVYRAVQSQNHPFLTVYFFAKYQQSLIFVDTACNKESCLYLKIANCLRRGEIDNIESFLLCLFLVEDH